MGPGSAPFRSWSCLRESHRRVRDMACRPMRFVRGYCFVFWFRHRDGVPSPSVGAGILPSRNSLRPSPSPARLQPAWPRVVTPRPEDPRLGPAATQGSHRRCQHARGSPRTLPSQAGCTLESWPPRNALGHWGSAGSTVRIGADVNPDRFDTESFGVAHLREFLVAAERAQVGPVERRRVRPCRQRVNAPEPGASS